MKTPVTHAITALSAAALASTGALWAGPLNPPAGPVTPTFKTLAEVEPRTAVNAVNTPGDATCLFRISQPGSYYLTGNITGAAGKNGITIAASGVMLDLNGFELQGIAGALAGVNAGGDRICVRNGGIIGWGGDGVAALNAFYSRFDRLLIRSCLGAGLNATAETRVADCIAHANGGDGIHLGLASIATGCIAEGNGNNGITLGQSAIAAQCIARSNGLDGISCPSSNTMVRECVCEVNHNDGIQVAANSLVVANTCNANGSGAFDGAGIHATSFGNTIESNLVASNDRGVHAEGSGNLIIRNTAKLNGGGASNFVLAAGNVAGPSVTGASIAASSNPHANYEY